MTRIVGGVRTISIANNAAPAWFTAMTDKTWATPVTNTLDSVKPSPEPSGNFGHLAITHAWTGGCVDQDRREYILAANGGHLDYAGNEVYACALGEESPAWVRLNDPSTDTSGDPAYNADGDYNDGKVRAVHGWNRCEWGNGKIWYGGLGGPYAPNSRWSTACWSFDRASLGSGPFPVSAAIAPWEFVGKSTYDGSPGSDQDWQQGNSTYDPVTRMLWVCSQYSQANPSIANGIYSVDTDTGTLTAYNIGSVYSSRHCWGVIPWDIGRYWIVGDKANNRLVVLDLTNPNAGWTVRSVTNANITDSQGAVYHAASQAILLWDEDGASIQKISVPSNPLTGSFVQSTISADGSNAIVPSVTQSPSNYNGTFRKFRLVNDMGNGQGALVVVLGTTTPVFVYKLPAAGV